MHATEFVRSYFDAWNHCDPKAVADHLAADGVYCDIPENARSSRDELIVGLKDFFSAHRHRYELIGEILEGESSIAFQYRMRPLAAFARGESSGASGAYRGAEFIALRGDAALTITDYYDAPLAAQPAPPLAVPRPRNAQRPKYAKSGLDGARLIKHKNRLQQIMQSEQLYLQCDLSLPRLAKAVGCSVNHLSQVINAGCNANFFDYLNRLRIDHAKRLLANRESRAHSVLEIALSVGFNSNSAFYAAFKRQVGQTPAQYRRAQALVSGAKPPPASPRRRSQPSSRRSR